MSVDSGKIVRTRLCYTLCAMHCSGQRDGYLALTVRYAYPNLHYLLKHILVRFLLWATKAFAALMCAGRVLRAHRIECC